MGGLISWPHCTILCNYVTFLKEREREREREREGRREGREGESTDWEGDRGQQCTTFTHAYMCTHKCKVEMLVRCFHFSTELICLSGHCVDLPISVCVCTYKETVRVCVRIITQQVACICMQPITSTCTCFIYTVMWP